MLATAWPRRVCRHALARGGGPAAAAARLAGSIRLVIAGGLGFHLRGLRRQRLGASACGASPQQIDLLHHDGRAGGAAPAAARQGNAHQLLRSADRSGKGGNRGDRDGNRRLLRLGAVGLFHGLISGGLGTGAPLTTPAPAAAA